MLIVNASQVFGINYSNFYLVLFLEKRVTAFRAVSMQTQPRKVAPRRGVTLRGWVIEIRTSLGKVADYKGF